MYTSPRDVVYCQTVGTETKKSDYVLLPLLLVFGLVLLETTGEAQISFWFWDHQVSGGWLILGWVVFVLWIETYRRRDKQANASAYSKLAKEYEATLDELAELRQEKYRLEAQIKRLS